jgi:hypothetical protein
MQQTLQHNSRPQFTGASKLLVGQQGGAGGAMMSGRMMAGGMGGQSLTSGLEDLKKTAGVGVTPEQQQRCVQLWTTHGDSC